MDTRFAIFSLGFGLTCISTAFSQSPETKQKSPNEAEVILQDSKKQDPETPKEITECMNQWGPQTQMTKDEWAASC